MKELKQFDEATDTLAEKFIKKYFGEGYVYNEDYYWVGINDEDREVLAVGDYFFNLEDIVSFLRYNYTEKELFEYYDYALDKSYREAGINIRNYKKTKK